MIEFLKRFARDERGGFSIGGFLGGLAKGVLGAIPIIGPAITAGFTQPRISIPGPTVIQAGLPSIFGRAVAPLLGAAARRIDRRKAVLLARELGIAAAAAALGITALELAELLVSAPRRRRRGITASQISTTKATIRRIDSLNRSIAAVCPPPARRRRAPSRAAIHHAT
jgi:hypothetical protein